MRFSVIVPVYNVEDYIQKCLESILRQEFDDYEIIVVDDETPDNSMAIVENMAQAYPGKIKIVHQTNKGLGGARNTGVQAAMGEYLIFVDSDDYIADGTLKLADARLNETPVDMLMFNFLEVLPSGEVLAKPTFFPQDTVCETTAQKAQLLLAPPCAWNKVFRREFYVNSGVSFPEKMWYEDAVTRILTAKADKVLLCKEHLYYYVQRQGSIMNSKVSPRVLDIITVTDLVYRAFEIDGLIDVYRDAIEAALTHSMFTIAENVYRQSPGDALQNQIMTYIAEKFPSYLENAYLSKSLKREIHCLVKENYIQYKWYKGIDKAKIMAYQNPVLRGINTLRKKIGL